ncbi:MAG: hypothetical protein KDC78_02110 [Aequorivita sp.]|nr:hypothetical protein [Aequorivita sp.]MCB0746012.1 hypothetical protein [Ignavibacteriota bacterium]
MNLKLKKGVLWGNGLLISLLILVFFYDVFSEAIGFYDEFLGLMGFVVISTRILFFGKIPIQKMEFYILLLLFGIIIWGLISNVYASHIGYTTKPPAIFADLVNFSKAFVVYFAVRFLRDSFDSGLVLDKLAFASKYIFFVLVMLIILDISFRIYPREKRFGLEAVELFFKHTSRYAFALTFIFLVLLPKYYKKNIGFLLFVLLVGSLSLRMKYFGFLFLTLIFLFYGKKLIKIPKTYFLWIMGILVLLMVVIFREKIEMYFSFEDIDNAWSRAIVLYYSFIIGNDFFPFGTGFGTYSSYYSGAYYSWVYDLYGISNVYGIKREYWNFIADQYWPMVLGQFGYLGLMMMFAVTYSYFMIFLTKVKLSLGKPEYYLYLSVLLGFLMLLIDSTSDSIFSQQRAVAMFIYFALAMNTTNK